MGEQKITQININRTANLERTATEATDGLNAFNCHLIFALDSAN